MIVSVDLATRYSAAVCLDLDKRVIHEYDSRNTTLTDFLTELGQSASLPIVEYVLLEDVSHGHSFRKDLRDSLRMQGMVLKEFLDLGVVHKAKFIQPNLWKTYYRVPSSKKDKACREKALELGYEPPDLHSNLHKQERTIARKSETDYIEAFLMGSWFIDQLNAGVDLDENKRIVVYEPW